MAIAGSGAAIRLAAGHPVVLVTGRGGGLLMSSRTVRSDAMAFAVRHGSGLIRVIMTDERADRLRLPLMWRDNAEARLAMTVCVDAAEGITTGISARDRAVTARLLAADETRPEQLRRPGHIIPVRASTEGPDTEQACLDTLRELRQPPVAVFTDVVVGSRGDVAGGAALRRFAKDHDLPLVTTGRSSVSNPALARSLRLLSGDSFVAL